MEITAANLYIRKKMGLKEGLVMIEKVRVETKTSERNRNT